MKEKQLGELACVMLYSTMLYDLTISLMTRRDHHLTLVNSQPN